ncbi:amidohydrolase [Sulfurimonas sp. HSL-3221]|uniref:amidohydrolase n=1 Tax=Sulfurimonadaceae TaxID=2771471 RepID=UPI001E3EBA4B|nr:amidohydrolase [Sulfurimonas sp. HSL-3221]UFS63305.1 amidohydrolase [Sulfurimonas sp. HSL-3221]
METRQTTLFETIDAIEERIVTLRHELHAHPELSGAEEHTTLMIKAILEAEGLQVRSFEEHYGLIAEIVVNPDAPFVALRADIDALPIQERTEADYASQARGIMHACGHDAHTAILLGTALALKRVESSLGQNLRFIFQPAEEITEGGSSQMIAHGALENVKTIFGLHAYPYLTTGQVGYKYGVMLASADTFEIEIFGKSAHGARPHEGVDAILVMSMAVNSLNHIVSRRIDPLHPAVISLGTVEGGKAPNVICDHVKVCGTVRTVNHDVRHAIPEMMEVSIRGICDSMHATYDFAYRYGSPEVQNHDAMVDIVRAAASEVLEEANVIDLADPVMGGEDFGRYLEIVPGAFFRLGTCDPEKGTCVAQHNARFDVDDDALRYGMKIMALAALKAMDDA